MAHSGSVRAWRRGRNGEGEKRQRGEGEVCSVWSDGQGRERGAGQKQIAGNSRILLLLLLLLLLVHGRHGRAALHLLLLEHRSLRVGRRRGAC